MTCNQARGIIRLLLIPAFIYFGAAIAYRAFFKPEPSKAVIHLECAAAVAFLACLSLAQTGGQPSSATKPAPWAIALPALAVLPFLMALRAPLLYDSYTHVVVASTQKLLASITTVYDFRPLGYLDYWLEYRWAGFHSALWHLDGLLLHLIAIYLLFALCRQLGLSLWASALAALFFGVHGANPETVFWTATRFDELATIFVLLTLTFACRYVEDRKLYIPMLVSCLLAVLSKESAYCLPGLAACCFWCRNRWNAAATKVVAGLGLVCAVVFACRFWVLGGIGGYRDASGNPMILHFNPLHTIEILFFKIWGVLLFPINWSAPPEKWLGVAVAILLVAAIIAATKSMPARHTILASLAFCLVAILPATHLASLDARIIGSRVFHLATIGLALMIGALYDAFSNKRIAVATVTGFLLFQGAALVHNLLVWRDTAYLARRACNAVAELSDTHKPVVVLSLPATHNGVFFLTNGFGDCVYVNSGKRLYISNSSIEVADGPVLYWDERSQSIKKK